ncbi:hypothetical protein GALL_385000 [mine drainage metagenome]|uniref:Uncharacterized protein n=1 Tax=mine drainage metagenome TaxID=410659 RepID=A0A1J5QQK8_9ZZZZ
MLLVSLLVIAGAGHRESLWGGLALWGGCGALFETATDATAATVAALCAAVVALLVAW